jgi:parvulin-like peptidyl-prolyl isomerase
MMQLLRNNTKVIIWILVVAFVGTIIFAWGMDLTGLRGGGEGGAPQNVVGSVDGKDIPLTNFNMAADQYIENERRKTPDKDFTESDYREARRQIWNEFVTSLLQQNQIEQKKLRLTDLELVEFIRQYPPQEVQQAQQFQTDGRFDYQKYVSAMTDPNFGQLWAQVEGMMRPRLINFKLQEYIGSMVRVSDADIQARYLRDNERINVDYALAPLNSFDITAIKVDPEQVKQYYETHQDEYKAAEQAYYTVVRALKGPSTQDAEKALEQITAIKAELDQGADFATVASAKTMDASGKNNGGDLGWFGRGQMVATFDSTVFSMKDSTISQPIKTQFGYHIIYRKGLRVTAGKEEVSAAHILIEAKASTETLDNLSQTLEKFRAEATRDNYSALIKQYNLNEDPERKLTRGGSITGLGRNLDVEKFLFEASPGTISGIYDKPEALYVFRADRVAPAGISSLAEVTPLIERNFRMEEQKKMSLARAEQIYGAVMSGSTLADAAKSGGYTVSESGFFARTGRLPSIGPDPNFIGTAFSLSPANRYSKPVMTQSGAVVMEFKERMPANLDGFAAEKDTLRNQQLMSLQNAYWDSWYNNIRTKSEIKDYRKEVFGESM